MPSYWWLMLEALTKMLLVICFACFGVGFGVHIAHTTGDFSTLLVVMSLLCIPGLHNGAQKLHKQFREELGEDV